MIEPPTYFNQLWYLIPLVIVISLVYGATRHEFMRPILVNAWRFGAWVMTFIAVIFVVLFIVAHVVL